MVKVELKAELRLHPQYSANLFMQHKWGQPYFYFSISKELLEGLKDGDIVKITIEKVKK